MNLDLDLDLDLDLHFQRQFFASFLICEYLVNDERQNRHYYCHQMQSRIVVNCDSAKERDMTHMDFGIPYPMASLRILYFVTLT